MKAKDKVKKFHMLKKLILGIFLLFIIIFIFLLVKYYQNLKTKNVMSSDIVDNVKISNSEKVDIEKYITTNNFNDKKEETVVDEEQLEYITKYRNNSGLPKNIVQVVQEGRTGLQKVTSKKIYDLDGNIIQETRLSSVVTKAAIDKIVEIGTANYTSSYTVKAKDNVYVTTDRLSVMLQNSSDSEKITTLSKDNKMTVKEINGDWYKISTEDGVNGWVKADSTTYIAPRIFIYR